MTARQTALRWVRRTHLYLGLLMWPFVLLFAITGLSFNHPTVGRGLSVKRASASEVTADTGYMVGAAGIGAALLHLDAARRTDEARRVILLPDNPFPPILLPAGRAA